MRFCWSSNHMIFRREKVETPVWPPSLGVTRVQHRWCETRGPPEVPGAFWFEKPKVQGLMCRRE